MDAGQSLDALRAGRARRAGIALERGGASAHLVEDDGRPFDADVSGGEDLPGPRPVRGVLDDGGVEGVCGLAVAEGLPQGLVSEVEDSGFRRVVGKRRHAVPVEEREDERVSAGGRVTGEDDGSLFAEEQRPGIDREFAEVGVNLECYRLRHDEISLFGVFAPCDQERLR